MNIIKKFTRQPPEIRKDEIKNAAGQLFMQKGFAATTMENIVDAVSLSKGGVYRFYKSTTEILSDIMLDGMRLRNGFYEKCCLEYEKENKPLTVRSLVEMIYDSLLLYPEISALYVEFLWEKRRNQALADLYDTICKTSVEETLVLIQKYGADQLFRDGKVPLAYLTETMNAAILGITVLDLKDAFIGKREEIIDFVTETLAV